MIVLMIIHLTIIVLVCFINKCAMLFKFHVLKGQSYADFVFLLLTLAWLFGVYLFSPNTEPNKFGQGETECSKAQGQE